MVRRKERLSSVVVVLVSFVIGHVQAQPSSPVEYTTVLSRPVRGSLQLSGSVQSRRRSVVASEVDGLVVSVDVDEGDRVRRGQALARLRARNFELRLRAAQGRLKEARARLDLTETRLKRARELIRDEIIAQGDLDNAISESAAWQGRVDETSAEIERLETDLERSVIRSPFSGVVVEKKTEVGQWVDRGGAIVELLSLRDLEVDVAVPGRYYRDLVSGGSARVRFEALPGFEVAGRIAGIIPSADPQARTFPVKVRIANPDETIGVGMLSQVFLPVGELRDALMVPKDAVVRQGGRQLVYRVNDDETVEPLVVQEGDGQGAWVVVTGPIAVGQRVVTRGNERLRPGQEVKASLQEYPAP